MEIRIRIWCQWARPFSVSPQKCFALVFKPQQRNGMQPANSAGEMGSCLLLLLMCKLNLFLFPSQSLQSGPATLNSGELNSGEWGNYAQFGKQQLKSQPSFRDLIKLGPCQFKQKSLNPCLTWPNQFSLMSFAIAIGAFLPTRMNGLEMLIKPCTVKQAFRGSSLSSLQHSKVKSLIKNCTGKCKELLHVNKLLAPPHLRLSPFHLPHCTF